MNTQDVKFTCLDMYYYYLMNRTKIYLHITLRYNTQDKYNYYIVPFDQL